jgi:hypothetical protein
MKFYHFKLQCRVCSYILQPFLTSFYQLTFQIHGLREWKLMFYVIHSQFANTLRHFSYNQNYRVSQIDRVGKYCQVSMSR